MGRPRGDAIGILLVSATMLCPAIALAADSPAEQVLAKQGLKRVGSVYVVDEESQVQKKLEEVRQLSKQWNAARVQQAAVGTAKDHQALIQDLSGQIGQIRAEIAAVNQQMARIPRFRGRWSSTYAQEQNAELVAYRNQLNMALNQQNSFLNQVRSHPPDPKLQQKLASDVESKHDQYVQEAKDLFKLVQTAKDKYATLSHNAEIKKALDSIEPGARAKPKLGPSHEFLAIGKLLDKLEKEIGDPPADINLKTTRKPKRTLK
jgi:hypothetical protein